MKFLDIYLGKSWWITHRKKGTFDRYGIFAWWRGWKPRFGLILGKDTNFLWFLFWGIRFGKNP